MVPQGLIQHRHPLTSLWIAVSYAMHQVQDASVQSMRRCYKSETEIVIKRNNILLLSRWQSIPSSASAVAMFN